MYLTLFVGWQEGYIVFVTHPWLFVLKSYVSRTDGGGKSQCGLPNSVREMSLKQMRCWWWWSVWHVVVGWQANPSDADQIYSAIYSRAQKLKSSTAAAATKPSSPVSKDSLLPTSSSVSSVSANEKRSSECVADSDLAVAEKRPRSVVPYLFTKHSMQSFVLVDL